MRLDLSSTLELGGRTVSSRLWCGPASWLAGDTVPDRQRVAAAARGLTGVVGLRATIRADGRSSLAELQLGDASTEPQCAALTEAVRASGGSCLVELTHGGPRSGDLLSQRPLGPAAVEDPINRRRPRPLDAAELDAIVEDFTTAGRRALRGGADLLGVEVADGCLLHAYHSPLSNGSGGGAAQPALEPALRVVEALRAEAPCVVTLCADDLCPGGLSASQGVEAARALVDAGAASIVVVAGGRAAWRLRRPQDPPGRLREAPHGRLARWVQAAVDVPVGVAGGLRSRAVMDALIGERTIDFAVLERPFACELELGERLRDNRATARCTSCEDCLAAVRDGVSGSSPCPRPSRCPQTPSPSSADETDGSAG